MNNHYHFIGIGGIGMGALASLVLDKGCRVSGSDLKENEVTMRLRPRGAAISIGHNAGNVTDADYVIYSSAVRDNNPELEEARNRQIPIFPRARLLAELMEDRIGITVAGAHGKTTTTSMAAALMEHAGLCPTTAIGGIVNGTHAHAQTGEGRYFIAEVDESDGSFLYFVPQYSIITNIDFEHIDYYADWEAVLKAYRAFIGNTAKDGVVIACGDDERLTGLLKESRRRFRTYGVSPDNDIRAADIVFDRFTSRFRVMADGQDSGEVVLNVPGRHNVLNALACVGLGVSLSMDMDTVREGLQKYTGVQRRFQLKGNAGGICIIDDYAHHPTEIRATLEAAQVFQRCAPGAPADGQGGQVISVFQPHRYSRVKGLLEEFADSLTGSDQVVVTDIYAASEQPVDGISGQALCERIRARTNKPVCYLPKEDIVGYLLQAAKPHDLVLTLGAGDITRIARDLAAALKEKKRGHVGVLMGGVSSERDISLKSGQAVAGALQGQGYDVAVLDITDGSEESILSVLRSAGVEAVFIALHGRLGEDGTIQSILEKAGIPYVGSGVEASRLAFDKSLAQGLLRKNGITVPAYGCVTKGKPFSAKDEAGRVGGFPVIVKPASEGSSIGITLAQTPAELADAVARAQEYGDTVLIEQYIQGREMTVAVLGQEALPVVEIRPKHVFFDFEAKYTKGLTDYVVPADIPDAVTAALKDAALKAHRALGCEDLSRVDFMLDGDGRVFCLEVNTIPGFTETSLVPKAALARGISFDQLVVQLMDLTYGKKKEIKDTTVRC